MNKEVFENSAIENQMTLTIVGLGKMGARMGAKLVKEGHTVYGWDVDENARKTSEDAGLIIPDTFEESILSQDNKGERVILQMLHPEPTETTLELASKILSEGDILIDGGNSKYQDTNRRAKKMTESGIRFLGMGVSGGIIAEDTGYPIMIGGDKSAYDHVAPILDSLAKPHGTHEYLGAGGAGHYVKMVHNAIEYPIMQAFGEGFGMLKASEFDFDLEQIAKLYTHGTLVSGFMNDRLVEALEADPGLSSYHGEIGSASGEAVWAVEEAKRLGVPTESMEQSIDFRRRSVDDENVSGSFAAKVVAALRATFGGHPVKRADK